MSLLTESPTSVDPTALPVLIDDEPSRDALRGSRLRRWAAAIGWGLVGIAALVAVWMFAAWRVPTLASPLATVQKLGDLAGEAFTESSTSGAGIGLQTFASLQRVFLGFALAGVVGIPAGLAIGCSRRIYQAANPVIQLLRPVSPLAWFPIWLVVFRDAPQAAVWVIFMTALWPIILNTAAGAQGVPAAERNVARVFHFGRLTYLRRVVVPCALPSIVTGLRLSMGVAWMVIVAVEMLSGGTGIGFFVWDSYNALDMPKLFAAIAIIGVIGLAMDLLFLRLGRAVTLEELS